VINLVKNIPVTTTDASRLLVINQDQINYATTQPISFTPTSTTVVGNVIVEQLPTPANTATTQTVTGATNVVAEPVATTAPRASLLITHEAEIDGAKTSVVSYSDAMGFTYTVPELLLNTPSGLTSEVTVRAVLADGSPLPSWLVFDPVTQTLSSQLIPDGAGDLTIKVQALNGDQVISESVIAIGAN
jgi:hypothetical protein